MEAREYRELLQISAVSMFTPKYYETKLAYYQSLIEEQRLPDRPMRPGMDMTQTQTKNAMIGFFSAGRRMSG